LRRSSKTAGAIACSERRDDRSIGTLSVQAQSIAGRALIQWREMQSAALAKALIDRASDSDT